ncbi:VanZ family protein [Flaviflagellibacter deserti]|uniref:VanZ family protein n=1 Tax=Flaviflagellibacter deserti TaxID=2267266 RepID=A0ABV9Z6F9_9HYPH
MMIGLFAFDALFGFLALMPDLNMTESSAAMLHVSVSAINVFILAAMTRSLGAASFFMFGAGVFVEFLQIGIAGRSASIDDLFADCIGISIGALLYWSLRPSYSRGDMKRVETTIRTSEFPIGFRSDVS